MKAAGGRLGGVLLLLTMCGAPVIAQQPRPPAPAAAPVPGPGPASAAPGPGAAGTAPRAAIDVIPIGTRQVEKKLDHKGLCEEERKKQLAERKRPSPPSTDPVPLKEFCNGLIQQEVQKALTKVYKRPEEKIEAILRSLDNLKGCDPSAFLDQDGYFNLLLTFRKTMAEWYQRDPAEAALGLLGGGGGGGGEKKAVPDRTAWAQRYLLIEEELREASARDEGRGGQPGQVLGIDVRVPSFPYQRIYVDALAGSLRKELSLANQVRTADAGGDFRSDTDEGRHLCAYQYALPQEIDLWEGRFRNERVGAVPPGQGQPAAAALTDLKDRIRLLTTGLMRVAGVWGERRTDPLRQLLGQPYQEFISRVSKMDNIQGESLLIEWGVPLDYPGTATPISRWATVKRILTEITVYDQLNLRAFFEMRGAHERWLTLLPRPTPAAPPETPAPRRGRRGQAPAPAPVPRPPDESLQRLAALELVRAFRHTESPRTRLEGVARLLNQANIWTGALVIRQAETADQTPGPVRQAGRRLAELGLCLLNRAYLKMDGAGADTCPWSGPPMECRDRPVAEEFRVVDRAHPPLDTAVRDAYEKVIAAVDANLPLRAQDTLAAGVRCELLAIFERGHFARLGLDLFTYFHAISLAARAGQSLKEDPLYRQAGPLLAQAMTLANENREGICANLALACEPAVATAIEGLAARASGPDRAYYELQREEFCKSVFLGHSTYTTATSPPPQGLSLVEYARKSLSARETNQIDTYGQSFAPYVSACGPTAGPGPRRPEPLRKKRKGKAGATTR